MKEINFDVEEREEKGSRNARRLKRGGFLPGVVYGGSKKPIPIKLDRKRLIHFLHGIGEENVTINLKIKKAEKSLNQLVILKNLDFDPVSHQLIHLDFQRVSMNKKISSEVHIVLKGEPEGIKGGGILNQLLRTIDIESLPQDMPLHVEVDISSLKIHDSLHVKDISLPPKVKALTDKERTILSILPPRKVEKVEEMKEKAEVEEPKVVTKEEDKEEKR